MKITSMEILIKRFHLLYKHCFFKAYTFRTGCLDDAAFTVGRFRLSPELQVSHSYLFLILLSISQKLGFKTNMHAYLGFH